MNTTKNKLGLWYDRTLGKLIPMYSFFSLIFSFTFNSVLYFGLQILMKDVKHFDLTSKLDRAIPFVPEWSFIYIGCYLFWAANYILAARQKKEQWFQFVTADYLSRIICALFFIVLPTTNIRPEVVGDGIPQILMRFVYQMDDAANLFPSIHCLVSQFCIIAVRGRKEIPGWYRIFSAVMAVLVFFSTLFTKQHYLIDVFAGVFLAEVCYYVGKHTLWYQKVMKGFVKVNRIVFGGEGI